MERRSSHGHPKVRLGETGLGIKHPFGRMNMVACLLDGHVENSRHIGCPFPRRQENDMTDRELLAAAEMAK